MLSNSTSDADDETSLRKDTALMIKLMMMHMQLKSKMRKMKLKESGPDYVCREGMAQAWSAGNLTSPLT